MRKNRIAWIVIIISAGLLYIFANETVTLAALVVCLASPAVSGALLILTKRKIKINLKNNRVKQGVQNAELIIENAGLLPVSRVQATIEHYNLRTSKEDRFETWAALSGRGKITTYLQSGFQHAGVYEIRAGNLRIFDPLQLFSRKSSAEDYMRMTVMPEVFYMETEVTAGAAMMLESDEYADFGRGNDPGEVRSIREYMIGDPVKNIHWKLSEKTDRLLIKELGLPVTDQLLVLLDTCAGEYAAEAAPDAIASVYTSMLMALQRDEMDFSAGWFDTYKGYPSMRKIKSESDIIAAADRYLSVPPMRESIFNSIKRGEIDRRFAHLIIVGTQIPSGISAVSNGCSVTLLLYGHAGDEMLQGGVSIIGFDEYSYRRQLAGLEV